MGDDNLDTLMTLQEIKDEVLGLDYADDDNYIEKIVIPSVQAYIDSCCGTNYKKNEDKKEIAKLLFSKITYDMYENRGTEIPSNTKASRYINTMLDILANCGDNND